MDDVRVLGLDACRKGWAGVLLDDHGATSGVFLTDLAAVDDLDVAGVGIDIPIGLAPDHVRAADRAAKAVLGTRSSSVFMTPVRAALAAGSHAEASATNRQATGKGISIQAWGLREKVLAADAWSRHTQVRHWEVHPEVSFTELRAGAPCEHPKTTWAGQQERRVALAAAGIHLDDVGEVGALAAADDVLDAAAVAWSTRRLVRGEGRSLPADPEHYDDWPHPVAIFA